jgi:GDPmannose 4,6-dehydratase
MIISPKADLTTGVAGQDSFYLAEFFLDKVCCMKHGSSSLSTQWVDRIYQDLHVENARLKLHFGDMSDSSDLTHIIKETQLGKIYKLGARSRGNWYPSPGDEGELRQLQGHQCAGHHEMH